MSNYFSIAGHQLYNADCRELLAMLPDNSVDSVVTDPPYHLTSVVKRFGGANAAPAKHGTDGLFARQSRGFMGQTWDGGDIAFRPELWAEVWRVLKPGGHLAAFSGTRTYHRMAVAIEDAGFEIRDQLAWCYGSGFPKSHDIPKAIDKALGAEGGRGALRGRSAAGGGDVCTTGMRGGEYYDYVPATAEATEWQGWGTALKPAWEPICFARKPLSEGTVADNVLRWGTGGLNIDGCRIHADDVSGPRRRHGGGVVGAGTSYEMPDSRGALPPGRFPANIVHDGSPDVIEAFPREAGARAPVSGSEPSAAVANATNPRGDAGSAARFFYCAKASKRDRGAGNMHPTVKPTDLMAWLCRLMTPRGGTVLDPFAGSGSTGKAAIREGFRFIGVEQSPEYFQIAAGRLADALLTEA